MAGTTVEPSHTAGVSKDKQKPTLLTPDTTPAPDEARNAAERIRKAADIENEITRILQSKSDLSTLGVADNSSTDDRLLALRTIGCKIHYEHSGYEPKEDAKKALQKLCAAAESLGVESPYASAVFHWDGKEDLMTEDSEDSDSSDSGDPMNEDSVPVPNKSVCEIYDKATPFVQRLASDPNDKDSHNGIATLNTEIIKATKEYNTLHKDKKAKKVSKTQWEIPLRFFQVHYSLVVANYNILMADPNNDEARQKVEVQKKLIRDSALKRHWPGDWTLDNLILPEKKGASSDIKAPFQYPWPTLQTDDGLIIGVRERAVGGPQVCVEATMADGRIVRRLESASDFGHAEVERYMKMPNYKSLSNAAAKFYRKDEADFKQLHWVTMSRIKNKNTATGKKDPPTDCCVEFKSHGLQIITVSNVCNILGRKNGRAAIEHVCKDHGIPPPWDREPMHTFYRLPKDGDKQSAAARWAVIDSPPQAPAPTLPSNGQGSTNSDGFQDPRVDSLNTKIANLETKIDFLTTAIEKIMAGQAGKSTLLVPHEEEEEL